MLSYVMRNTGPNALKHIHIYARSFLFLCFLVVFFLFAPLYLPLSKVLVAKAEVLYSANEGGAGPDEVQRCYKDVTAVLQRCYSGVTVVLWLWYGSVLQTRSFDTLLILF
jgi:hypothetical protein